MGKKTATINRPHLERNIRPIIGIIPVSCIISPIIGIPDIGNDNPHSYFFLLPRAEWPNFFVKRICGLVR